MKRLVLLKSEFYRLGGLEKYARRLAQLFSENSYEVTILSTSRKNSSPSYDEFKLHSYCPKNRLSFLKVLEFDRFCGKYLKKNPADIVFGLDRNRFQTHLRAGNGVHRSYLERRRLFEPKWVHLRHRLNPLHQTILRLEKQAFEDPNLQTLYTNSHMVKEEILHYYQVDPKKVRVVHNGVEWKEKAADFQNWPLVREAFFRQHGLEPGLFHLLFVGHHFARKGLPQLLRALSQLSSYPFYLSVVGSDKQIELYKKMTSNLKLQNKVHFFGEQAAITPFYQMADALVVPSLYDPFANVTLEGLNMGLFCLTTKSNGAHEILTKENGLIVQSIDVLDELCEGLKTLFTHPKTAASAKKIRGSVESFDFSSQLKLLLPA